MTSNIDTIIAADLAATVFDTAAADCPAVTVAYVAGDAAAVELAMIIEDRSAEIVSDGSSEDQRGRLIGLIAAADLAAVTGSDTITLGAMTYRVSRWEPLAGLWRITADRCVALDRVGPNARKPRES